MNGLFNEMGPCTILRGSNVTSPNPHSWNANASVLFIDQPAGVGFSTIKAGTPYVRSDIEAAENLQAFLRIFFDRVFPSKAKLPMHLAAESYGGHYAPITIKHILDSRENNSPDAFWGDIKSIALVNALVEPLQSTIGHYQLFCTDYRGHLWNQTVCDRLAEGLPKAEELDHLCQLNYDKNQCADMVEYAYSLSVDVLFEEAMTGKRNQYYGKPFG